MNALLDDATVALTGSDEIWVIDELADVATTAHRSWREQMVVRTKDSLSADAAVHAEAVLCSTNAGKAFPPALLEAAAAEPTAGRVAALPRLGTAGTLERLLAACCTSLPDAIGSSSLRYFSYVIIP